MNTRLSILFYAKKAKAASEGLLPIYLRITINGQRFETSTKRLVEPDQWSVSAGQFLSEEEIQLLHNKEFSNFRISQVRDIFLFSCYTGLAYIDVKKLTPNHISIGIDGEKWIFTQRQKTESLTHIPLLPPALDILAKYKDDIRCLNKGVLLPVFSNQKMNTYLKEIADVCGIQKNMTFHMARHTFATTVTLSNNVPIESVSKMLGHRSIKQTQHYAKILDKRVSYDMQQLKSRFPGMTDRSNKETG